MSKKHAVLFKRLGSVRFLFSKDALNVTVGTFIMLQNISVSHKCCPSFELCIDLRILKK